MDTYLPLQNLVLQFMLPIKKLKHLRGTVLCIRSSQNGIFLGDVRALILFLLEYQPRMVYRCRTCYVVTVLLPSD